MKIIERGERPCKECGKPHAHYWKGDKPNEGSSWADPNDGHTYQPLSWEQMYRREAAK